MRADPMPRDPESGLRNTVRYDDHDAERFVPERHENRGRSTFARDRARIVHSSGLRRLAQKTQVLSPIVGLDFARNRLTHSLEVAQVGREIAGTLGADPDIVDTACLAHDIGHPPFGHNGERALDRWAADIGGFEGNAQSLRLISRLEPKVFDAEGNFYGLNLTRASLDAACKYPWTKAEASERGTRKFGAYAEDLETFTWMRRGAPPQIRSLEAQIMDLSDDIAYSVHDLEDAIFSGYIPVDELNAAANRPAIVFNAVDWSGSTFTEQEIDDAFARLQREPYWIDAYDGSARSQARLKNLTSQLIGRFAQTATRATIEAHPDAELVRYGASMVVPRDISAEIALLKGAVAGFVMSLKTRQPEYERQRRMLAELLDLLAESAPVGLDGVPYDLFVRASTEAQRRRAIVDQVANLTDQGSITLHADLLEGRDGAHIVI